MNKSFVLLDKNNNLQKNATVIVKFSLEGKDYLVYSVDENEQNSQIFVSKLILNSEGKYFIDNILPDEKGILNNIVYNIVILVPSDAQKGTLFEVLSNSLMEKFSVKLSLDIPSLDMQEYYSNCSVAITSKILVNAAIKLYKENLVVIPTDVVSSVPTWTAPVEVTAPTPVDNHNINNQASVVDNQSVQATIPNLNIESTAVVQPVANSVSNQTVEVPTVTTPSLYSPLNFEPSE